MVNPLQILNQDGEVADLTALKNLGLDAEDIEKIFEWMLLTRVFGEHMSKEALPPDPKMALYISPRGQEAAEIGSAYALGTQDVVLAYARSQGPAFVKGVSPKSVADYFCGNPSPAMREDFNNHLVHLFYGLVAAHLPHASGLAWGSKLSGGEKCAVAAYIGEGATSEGDFHSAMRWSRIFKVPLIIICENNQVAISTPAWRQKATHTFAEMGLGYNVPWELVDGNDPLAMYAATRIALLRARTQNIPTLIEAITQRDGPHTTAIQDKREMSEAERQDMAQKDPLRRYKIFMASGPVKELFSIQWNSEKESALEKAITEEVKKAIMASLAERTRALEQAEEQAKDGRHPAIIAAGIELASSPSTAKKTKQAVPRVYEPAIIEKATGRHALTFGVWDSMAEDEKMICIGEDIAEIGGVHSVCALPAEYVKKHLPQYSDRLLGNYLPLVRIFGPERLVDTPLDESGIVGHAIGLAKQGLRVIVEIQFSGFVWIAMHQIVEAARIFLEGGGLQDLSIVIRLPYGGGRHIPYHRECEMQGLLMPGVIAACPSTVQDCYDLIRAATASNGITIFYEHKGLYATIQDRLIRREPYQPLEEFNIRVAKEGNDITVAACGKLLHSALEAAKIVEAEDGITVEVLDVRILYPLKPEVLISSVNKTGRLLALQEEPRRYGTAAEWITAVAESPAYYKTQARFRRLTAPDCKFPQPDFWKFYIPQVQDIVRAIRKTINDTED